MIEPQEIERRITEKMPDADVRVADLTGGRDHYAVEVVSSSFAGLGPVERHRLVYGLFKDVIGGALHALSLSTKSPDD